jgi:predicted hydrocarbon binding protein
MNVLLTRFGYDGGLAQAAVISDLYRFDSPEELLKAGGVMRRLAGLAHETITEIDFNPEKKQLRFKGIWKESFEPDIFRCLSPSSDKPVCSILTGLVSGYASAVMGTEMLVKEISCKAQGFDHCTFEGRTLGEWGLSLDDAMATTMTLTQKVAPTAATVLIQGEKVRPLGGSTLEPVKARILAATNQEIREMVAKGTFREDLYFRISVFPITLPPLRNRREDILPLARHFLSRLSPGHPGFSPQAIQQLELFSWPGNIRELENVIEYGVILAGDKQRILPEHFPNQEEQTGPPPMAMFGQSLPTCRELEQQYICHVLNQTNGNKTEASRILGLSISTLWRRLNQI